jgi:hypothetical protein
LLLLLFGKSRLPCRRSRSAAWSFSPAYVVDIAERFVAFHANAASFATAKSNHHGVRN